MATDNNFVIKETLVLELQQFMFEEERKEKKLDPKTVDGDDEELIGDIVVHGGRRR